MSEHVAVELAAPRRREKKKKVATVFDQDTWVAPDAGTDDDLLEAEEAANDPAPDPNVEIAAEDVGDVGAEEELPRVTFDAPNLSGDLRDFILSYLRENYVRPWDERSEAEQTDVIDRVSRHAQYLIRCAIDVVRAANHPVIRGTLKQLTVNDGIKALVEVSRHDEQRHALMDRQGDKVLIVVVDEEQFFGERAPVVARPDQTNLVF